MIYCSRLVSARIRINLALLDPDSDLYILYEGSSNFQSDLHVKILNIFRMINIPYLPRYMIKFGFCKFVGLSTSVPDLHPLGSVIIWSPGSGSSSFDPKDGNDI